MNVDHFDWDRGNVDHIARHKVTTEEVEELFDSKHYILRSRSGRYLVFGRTAAGRYLVCVIEKMAIGIRPVTARGMSDSEKRLSKRKVM